MSVVIAALLVAAAWLSLEQGPLPAGEVAPMLALAFLPPIAVALGRGRVVIALVGAAATLVAASAAFDAPLTNARPRDPEHDFFGPVLDSFRKGVLDFYEVAVPFHRADAPFMHSVVLIAVFGFVAAAGTLLAARRPIGAAVVVVTAIGVPMTLAPGDRPLLRGALALAGLLAFLFLLRDGRRPARGLVQGFAVGVALVLAATVVSSSNAVAKGAFVGWKSWDPYDRPDDPVGVRYVWNSHYLGIRYPKKKTVVLRIRASGPQRSLYWRATTLDVYDGRGWRESVELGPETEGEPIEAVRNLLPRAARDEDNWVRQEVTVEALRDSHLVASAQPIRWNPPDDATVQHESGNVVVQPEGLSRGQRYTVWSYAPQPKPARLAETGTDYPEQIEPYLAAIDARAPLPEFGDPSRDAFMDAFFSGSQEDFLVASLKPLYDSAREVVGEAGSPYAAAAALEAWFRNRGGFTYDEQPPLPGAAPALTQFVALHRRGYCQYYAGAMATMLRLLGVPARVAAGFTSGSYDPGKREWTVTDHNAHTWVEVFFPGFGWLPFDPTPGRGQLGARYSAVTPFFSPDARDAAAFQGIPGLAPTLQEALRTKLEQASRQPEGEGAGATIVRENAPNIVTLLALVLAAGLAVLSAVKGTRRALRFATRDTRALASACRRDLVGFLADQGVALAPSATLAEVGRVVEHDFAIAAAPFVRRATMARFGRPGEAETALRSARRELRVIRRQLRRQLSIPSRVRGTISLRSLGV